MAKIKEIQYEINEKKVIIRNAEVKDAQSLIHFLKKVDGETTYLMREPDEFKLTLEHEEKFVQNILDSNVDVFLAAEVEGEIVGTCMLSGNVKKRLRHSVNLGIAIEKEYWGMSIGKKLMEAVIKWAKNTGISRITLQVDTVNLRALNLYLKFGFEVEGTLKKDKRLSDGTYVNTYAMALLLDQ